MPLKNTEREYGLISKLFHWIVFINFIALFSTVPQMDELPDGPEKVELIRLHISLGLSLLVLMSGRLIWRWLNVRPDDVENSAKWQNITAHWLHIGIYVFFFTQMISGILQVLGKGFDLAFYGMVIFSPAAENELVYSIGHTLHAIFSTLILASLLIHILAALYHHFVRKDNVLRRMTVGVKND